ncbi:MAG: SNF2-related protein [Gammaproteobacteria bacterium]|nr:SNF2-related protein [Gammaproteobacteria bacterium]MDE0441392.1 SNF2-related protein [Gammaproteobacteria bacterium]
MLRDRDWKLKYTPDDGDLVERFYVPALEDAERYDRLTGYFNAHALALASRGIEGLVRNGGRMRLVVGCTLDPPEVEAIKRGEDLRDAVERKLVDLPLAPSDGDGSDALELLSWMVAKGHLDVKVAVPCDGAGRPVPDHAIFHEKTGIIEDTTGERIAWTGSLNETAAGWRTNWETINVFRGWSEAERVDEEERNFARIWGAKDGNGTRRLLVLDVPTAVRKDLMRFLPKGEERPKRLIEAGVDNKDDTERPPPERTVKDSVGTLDPRAKAWALIRDAASLPDGECVGEATSAVTPWPHQVRAFQRLYDHWPPRLLIADEVGLGKTIQAGMLIRQAWLAGLAKRVLVLAPKALLRQWQIELREKLNLNWPIYDGARLSWRASAGATGSIDRRVGRDAWHRESAVIASSQLVRRTERAEALLQAEPWDLVVLDEAHHARRRGGTTGEDRPNALLGLMRRLRDRTEGLLLLTATPMQVDPVEVWDLLRLLGLPDAWTAEEFIRFFEDVGHPNPSNEVVARAARLFRSAEEAYGPVGDEQAQRIGGLSRLRTRKVLSALRDARALMPLRRLENDERSAALAVLRSWTPLRHLVSRHTRELLRRYFREGMLATPIADRDVKDRFIDMTNAETALYEAVDEYIASTYANAAANVRNAVGFVMTVYRRRLASSFHALAETLRKRLDALAVGNTGLFGNDEDASDDETGDTVQDAEEVADLERRALAAEERDDIAQLLAAVEALPPDSKLAVLSETLDALRADGYRQAMVFTQYTDTMDFLRDRLARHGGWRLMCFSGRGGEVPAEGGGWRRISREDAKRRFRDEEADVLLCTDAAAEGLNFQFCGALVNYDMPWNPMRVEQRIGRIDRLGQAHPRVRIVNLHYEDTVETDVYRALRGRIKLFESVVGPLQPILARLPGDIGMALLRGNRENIGEAVKARIDEEGDGFDIDAGLEDDLKMPERGTSPLTMDYLDEVLSTPELMAPGVQVRRLGPREYGVRAPGMDAEARVTTDPAYYEAHADSLEFWSPGGALFERVRL